VLKHVRLGGEILAAQKKIAAPFALVTSGGGGDGGPGSRVERDGERCYRGAPVLAGGEALTGMRHRCLHLGTQAFFGWFAGREILENWRGFDRESRWVSQDSTHPTRFVGVSEGRWRRHGLKERF
jgi:hypothetical protein